MDNLSNLNHGDYAYEDTQWNHLQSQKFYRIAQWGNGYFTVNSKGNLCVRPNGDPLLDDPNQSNFIDVYEVIQEVKRLGIGLPVVIRFHDILQGQVIRINRIFRQTIEQAQFNGHYFGVFPIKVNQMREVIEEVVEAGDRYNYGLEAGSKPELLAALALNTNSQSLTILNGHKDEDYLRLGLLGRTLGRKVIIVIEKFSELEMLIRLSKEVEVTPLIGLRAKLDSQGCGKWAKSSGTFAKFGLSIPEILSAIKLLQDNGLKDALCLLHFHLGSQITEIRSIKDAITEAARVYSKLRLMGCPIEYFDVGGGVGVDYIGLQSNADSSMNYSMQDYVADVVYILKEICDLEDVEHPHIVTETGRAVCAYHSCIITNIFGEITPHLSQFPTGKNTGEHNLVSSMRDLLDDLNQNNIQDVYNDATQKHQEMISAFKLGILTLEERGKIETIFWDILKNIVTISRGLLHIPIEILQLQEKLSRQYLCNFSVFQSAIDFWAIGQLLPIVPIHRHNEKPSVHVTIADITCDSDGKIDHFIGTGDYQTCEKTLPLHPIKKNEEYYIGFFLTGAYQDIMGDMHNLFGRPNEVHVFSDDVGPSNYYIEEIIPGNTAYDVLSTFQYSPHHLSLVVKKSIDTQIKRGKIKPRDGVHWVDFYDKCLKDYTYLSH